VAHGGVSGIKKGIGRWTQTQRNQADLKTNLAVRTRLGESGALALWETCGGWECVTERRSVRSHSFYSLMQTWSRSVQAIKSSGDAHPFKMQSEERRGVLPKPLWPRGSGSGCYRHVHGDLGPGWDLGLRAGLKCQPLGRGRRLGTAYNKLTVP